MSDSIALYLRYFKRLRSHYFPLFMGILSDFLATFLSMIPPLFSILIFDYAYPQRNLSILTGAILAGLALYFVNFFFSSINDYLNAYVDKKFGMSLASEVFEKIIHLPLTIQSKRNSGDLTVRALEDTDLAGGLLLNTPQVILINLATLVIFLVISLRIDPYVTLLSLLSIPFYIWETHFFSGHLEKLQRDVQTNRAATLDGCQERLASLRTIKAFGQESFEISRFNTLLNRRLQLGIKNKVISFISAFTNSITLQVWATFMAWYMGFEVIQGRLSIGELIALGAYLPQIAGPIHELANLYTNFRVGMVSLRRVNEILELPSENRGWGERNLKIEAAELELKSLQFFYEPLRSAIQGLDIKVPPRSSLALVGASGSGKSTLVNLLLRLYEPDQGMILVDGQNIRDVRLASLRSQIGVVFQETSLFAGSVRGNILYGAPDKSENDMKEAAELAAAHEFISRLPNGYDTLIEPFGTNLSGGQKQRIAIARALVRKPRILILDEAVSALDAESEFLVQDTIDRLRGKMTVVLVAHRLSSVKGVDQIVVLEDGRIKEWGSFNDLLQRKGAFFRLFNLQTGGFEEFQQRLQIEFARHERYQQELSLLVLQANEYDHYARQEKTGRMARLMEELNLQIRRRLRIMDFSAVFRESQILIGLPETSPEDARTFGLRIGHQLAAETLVIDEETFSFTFTLKLASCKGDQVRYAEELMERAEQKPPLFEPPYEKTERQL